MTSLAEPYADRYDDPLARIDWTGVAHDCWWLPPSALSLAGVPAFEALPLATRRRLSHLEYVHLLETGLWLESLFIARLAQLAHASRDVAERALLLQEVREEAGHSLMFVELLRRSGFGVGGRTAGMKAVDALGRLLPTGSALFWAIVVVGEELPDRLNRRVQRAVDDVTLSAVVWRMARIHTHDEAQHAAYARRQCESSRGWAGRAQRALFTPAVSTALNVFARYVYYPPLSVYARAGLAHPKRWRALARDNPVRHAQVGEMLRPTVEFLRRSGWRVSSRYVR